MLYFKRIQYKEHEFSYWDDEDPRVNYHEPVLLLDTVSNVKAADQVKLINQFLGVHDKLLYEEQQHQLIENLENNPVLTKSQIRDNLEAEDAKHSGN